MTCSSLCKILQADEIMKLDSDESDEDDIQADDEEEFADDDQV